jgi:FkbM family methyltransferase
MRKSIIDWEAQFRPTQIETVNFIKSFLKQGDTFVDIGANTGLLTQMIVESLPDEYLGSIIMFEPIPYLCDECKNKFGSNPKFTINQLGLSDRGYMATVFADNINLGYNKIYKEGMGVGEHTKYIVECTTFSNWTSRNNIDKVDFVKIDAEGHDIEIIRGMYDFLRKTEKKPYILFEVGWYKDSEDLFLQEFVSLFNYEIRYEAGDVLLIPFTATV